MSGERTERFVVLGLRLLAVGFASTGILFLAAPNGVLEVLDDVGDWFGSFTPAPETGAKLWLTLGFSYMVVIAALCVVAQADIVRYRALLLVLAAGKAASSLTALGFYAFDAEVFAYLLNFLLDGSLVGIAIWLWALVGRAPAPAAAAPD
jgi:hypothetical protein